MTTPLVTVLMPAYNAELYLEEAIESILNQSFRDFEFLIINDGSTDRTEEIILSYDDNRIRYVKNENNLKLIATLNKGLELARGKYIARMDADDISLPNRLALQVELMEKDSDVVLCGSFTEVFSDKRSFVRDYPLGSLENELELLVEPCVCHPTTLIRKNVVNEHNLLYNDLYLHAEDYKLWTELIKYGKIININQPLLRYRKHSSSVTALYFTIALENRTKIRKEYIECLLNVSTGLASEFYGEIGIKRLKATNHMRKQLNRLCTADSVIDGVLFQKLWYKDALYESEHSLSILLRYPLIFLIKFDNVTFKNWINVFKHCIKFRFK